MPYRSLAYPVYRIGSGGRRAALLLAAAALLAGCASADPMAAGLEAAREGDYRTAYEEWLPLAEDGDNKAQFNIGELYRRGAGVRQNYAKAAKWYSAAAELYLPEARYNLALLYEKGLGVPINYEEARKLYLLAANQGYRQAQFNLGVMYSIGQGTAPDWPQAAMWYTLAARAGDERAASNLATLDQRMSEEQRARTLELLAAWERKWGPAE